MFTGSYNDRHYHDNDLSQVLSRASLSGVQKLIITGTSTEESSKAHELASGLTTPELPLYFTCGVHPTSCGEYADGVEGVEAKLVETITAGQRSGRLVAIGEAGLDYDRLHYCDAKLQGGHLFPYSNNSTTYFVRSNSSNSKKQSGFAIRSNWLGGFVYRCFYIIETLEQIFSLL